MVDKAPHRAQSENKFEGFQKVLIRSGIGGKNAGSCKDVCHDTLGCDTKCVMTHFARG